MLGFKMKRLAVIAALTVMVIGCSSPTPSPSPPGPQESDSRSQEPESQCSPAPAALVSAIEARLTATPDEGTPVPGGVSLADTYIVDSRDALGDFYPDESGEFESMYFVGGQILGEGMINIGAVWVTDDPSGGGSIFAVSNRARQFSDWPDRAGLEPTADGFVEADACAHLYNGAD